MNPLMSHGCILTLEKYINKETVFLEIGSGGSTCYFAPQVKKYYSLENNIEWYNLVKKELDLQAISNVDYRFIPPTDTSYLTKGGEWWNYEVFGDYIEEISNLDEEFDFILIDGFARNHCYLKCFNYIKDDGHIMIHDFYNLREESHLDLLWNFDLMFKYYDEVESRKQIGPERGNDCIVLKKKSGVEYDPKDMEKFDVKIPRYV